MRGIPERRVPTKQLQLNIERAPALSWERMEDKLPA
jgi:hypothetical protein